MKMNRLAPRAAAFSSRRRVPSTAVEEISAAGASGRAAAQCTTISISRMASSTARASRTHVSVDNLDRGALGIRERRDVKRPDGGPAREQMTAEIDLEKTRAAGDQISCRHGG